jgi:ABC-type phosphate transport system permease subunit
VTIGLAIWVGKFFGEMYLGFFIVAAAYAILGLIYCVFLFRYNKKTIEKRLINFLVD